MEVEVSTPHAVGRSNEAATGLHVSKQIAQRTEGHVEGEAARVIGFLNGSRLFSFILFCIINKLLLKHDLLNQQEMETWLPVLEVMGSIPHCFRGIASIWS